MKWKTLHISLTCSYIFKSIKGFRIDIWDRIQFTKKLTPNILKCFSSQKDGIWTFKASQCQPHWSLFNGHNFIFFALETSATLPATMPIYYICIILLFFLFFPLPCPLTPYKNKARLPTYLPKNSCIGSFTFNKLISQTAGRRQSWGMESGVGQPRREASGAEFPDRKESISRLAKVQAGRRSSPKWQTY